MTNPETDASLNATAPSVVRRAIVARRSLPNGRALVGALLVTVAAVGAFVFANGGDSGPTTEYLVLLRDINAGESITASDVGFEPMTLSAALAEIAFAGDTTDTSDALAGATALHFLHAGGLLLVPDVREATQINGTPTTGMHELTLPVPLDRTPEFLQRGDLVTILAYDQDNERTLVALEDALVLGINSATDTLGSNGQAQLTLGLSDADLVVQGTHLSFLELTVVLTSRSRDDLFPEVYPNPEELLLDPQLPQDQSPLFGGPYDNGGIPNER